MSLHTVVLLEACNDDAKEVLQSTPPNLPIVHVGPLQTSGNPNAASKINSIPFPLKEGNGSNPAYSKLGAYEADMCRQQWVIPARGSKLSFMHGHRVLARLNALNFK